MVDTDKTWVCLSSPVPFLLYEPKKCKQKYGAVVFSILQKVCMYKPSMPSSKLSHLKEFRTMNQFCKLFDPNIGN